MGKRHKTICRRKMLSQTALAATVVPASALAKAGLTSPANRLTLGFIGLGSMGMRHIKGFLQEPGCRITAVCDVDRNRLKTGINEVSKYYKKTGAIKGSRKHCRFYKDFRKLVDRNDIDGLVVAVPDHWHSVIGIAGVREGKHIYGEKPLALTVSEGREMVRAVNRYGCVWQMGSWQRSTKHFRLACELVRNQCIGKLRRVEVGIGVGPACGVQPVMPVPEGFDYDMWLGPAPWAPYTKKRCHWNFRWILDYSGGQVTDWGAHHIDIAHWGMGADGTGPVEVEGHGEFPPGLWNTAVHYKFTCKYANGVTMLVASNNYIKQGVRWIGDNGWVHVTRGGLSSNPDALLKHRFGPNDIRLPRPPGNHRQGHRRDFLKCAASGRQPITPVEVGHTSITVAHLGNIAMLLDRKISWDPKAEKIIGDPEANRMLSRPMRSPWHT